MFCLDLFQLDPHLLLLGNLLKSTNILTQLKIGDEGADSLLRVLNLTLGTLLLLNFGRLKIGPRPTLAFNTLFAGHVKIGTNNTWVVLLVVFLFAYCAVDSSGNRKSG